MKATKLLGSVALTAALTMGTVPAFATMTAPNDWEPGVDQGIGGAGVSTTNQLAGNIVNGTNNTKIGTGSTAVKASVFDADLQVTIPLQLSVAFASTGSTLTCPSNGTYKITNNGNKAVKITHINATASGFNIVPLSTATTDLTSPTYYDTVSPGNRGIAMVLDFGSEGKVDLSRTKGWTLDGKSGSLKAGSSDGVQEVTIPAKAGNVPGTKSIDISGATTKFERAPLIVGYQTSTIMEIQYTVQTD